MPYERLQQGQPERMRLMPGSPERAYIIPRPPERAHTISGPPERSGGRLYALGALLLLLCGAAAWLFAHDSQESAETTAARPAGFAVTRASGTTDGRLILDCTMPAMQDEDTLRRMAHNLYAAHRGGSFDQVLIRYRLDGTPDAQDLKAIAVLTKHGSTLGIPR